eukprot:5672362-Heterocapsa_arctica.AAC.1
MLARSARPCAFWRVSARLCAAVQPHAVSPALPAVGAGRPCCSGSHKAQMATDVALSCTTQLQARQQ